MRYILCLLLMLLSGCKEKELTPVGQDYHLIHPEAPITISLKLDTDGRFYGKAVNNYFGVYKIKDTNIAFDLQGQTMMAAPLPHMEFEYNYLKSLRNIQKFQLKENQLILEGDSTYIFKSNTN